MCVCVLNSERVGLGRVFLSLCAFLRDKNMCSKFQIRYIFAHHRKVVVVVVQEDKETTQTKRRTEFIQWVHFTIEKSGLFPLWRPMLGSISPTCVRIAFGLEKSVLRKTSFSPTYLLSTLV